MTSLHKNDRLVDGNVGVSKVWDGTNPVYIIDKYCLLKFYAYFLMVYVGRYKNNVEERVH